MPLNRASRELIEDCFADETRFIPRDEIYRIAAEAPRKARNVEVERRYDDGPFRWTVIRVVTADLDRLLQQEQRRYTYVVVGKIKELAAPTQAVRVRGCEA